MSEHQSESPNLLPKLYSKTVIVVFSCLFSTLFGAVLLYRNLKLLNNHTAALQVLLFGISYTFLSMMTLNFIGQSSYLGIVFNIAGSAILNEYFWNKFIGKELDYEPKNWIKPALICVAITIPLIYFILRNVK